MKREEFDALIKRLEESSRRRPRGYLFQVAGLAALGYAYIFLVLLISLALTVGLLALMIFFPNAATIKLGVVFGIVTGSISLAILKALWIRLPPPQGEPITRAEAPALFALLDELSAKLRAPRFHDVVMVGEYNAAVSQIPRLGVFGWQRNYLILGLPLLQSLSPDEFRAVMAHEFAHLSGNHSQFSAWIYRVRRTWERVFEEMFKQRRKAAAPLAKFIDWFWPKFNAHAFVLARANEYEADACSARFAGAATAASALKRVKVHAALLDEKFWPGVLKQANQLTEPPRNVFADMSSAFHQPLPPDDSARWLRTAFLLETNNLDTHPSLKDRLRALGELPDTAPVVIPTEPPPSPETTAAQKFLGAAEATFTQRLSERWRKTIEAGWKQRNQQAAELSQKLAKLEQDSATAADVETLWAKARTLLDLEGDAGALPVVLQILGLKPEHALANFVRGRHSLVADNPAGVEFMERAIAADATLTTDACNVLYAYYARSGQREKMRELEKRADAHSELQTQAAAERNRVTVADTFIAHELTAEEITKLREVFAAERDLASVAAARKLVRVFPQSPLFLFSLKVKVSWWKPRSTAANQQLVNRVVSKIGVKGHFQVFVAEKNLKSLGARVANAPGAEIYRRAE